jgi:hypothetical protein
MQAAVQTQNMDAINQDFHGSPRLLAGFRFSGNRSILNKIEKD